MKKFLLLNVSPRKTGTSITLAGMCQSYLESRGHQVARLHLYPNLEHPERLVQAMADCDTLILSGPCYVNTYPADTIAFLELLAQHGEVLHGQDLYGIIQGGMPYAHTHHSGLTILECFGRKHAVQYKGGFAMGGGAFLNGQPVSKLPNGKKVTRQLNDFFDHIEKGEESSRSVYQAAQMKLPGIVCRVVARLMNRFIDKEITKKGHNPHQPSPYLHET